MEGFFRDDGGGDRVIVLGELFERKGARGNARGNARDAKGKRKGRKGKTQGRKEKTQGGTYRRKAMCVG